jgi:AhpD family alkylhydroperoxidase
MARIPYADENQDPEIKALAQQISAERGGRVPTLYQMLLNSPPVARGWLNLLTAVQQQCKLAARYREMVIIRVAILNGAGVEHKAHVPHAHKAGVSEAKIEALAEWQGSSQFDDVERAVLAYTDSMTREIHVPDAVFAAVRKHFDDREITELTATIAAYNLVSRFLEALQVDHTVKAFDFSYARK